MAISADSPYAERATSVSTTNNNPPATNGKMINDGTDEPMNEKLNGHATGHVEIETANMAPPKASIDTSGSSSNANSIDIDDVEVEFAGDVNTNNEIPTKEVLDVVGDMTVFDREGKIIPFKSLYAGPNVTRRVLIIFIRHFFCGNCQEYLRTLATSITPDSLLALPTPTFIAIVGHGSPSLIPMYAAETHCPFPIYADPTKRLYNALGMLRTLNLGARPEYQRRGTLMGMLQSVKQGVTNLRGGKALKGLDWHQVGGEFLFEPVDISTPIASPADEITKQLGGVGDGQGYGEEKRITWCHRMKNTRDHAELPELREVLGLDGDGVPGKDRRRWTKALGERKGTGLSMRSSSSTNRNGGNSGRQSFERHKTMEALDSREGEKGAGK